MALFDDAAYDEDLADDWEAALEAEAEAEEAVKRAQEEKRIAKERKLQKRIAADEQEETVEDASQAANMLAEAFNRETGAQMFGGKEVGLWEEQPSSLQDYREYGGRIAAQMSGVKDRKAFPVAMNQIFKSLGEKLTTNELNALLSKIRVLANQKKGEPQKPSKQSSVPVPRGSRNADTDAFGDVTDRGGAFVTEDQDFM